MFKLNLPTIEDKGPQISQSPEQIVKPSKVLIEWEAPERLFVKRPREFYRKIAIIILFFAFLLLIIKEFLLIGVLGVVFFVVYVFHTVPPRTIKHQITTNGINYASEHLYRWDVLRDFFIDEKDNVKILNVNTKDPLPGRIFMLLSKDLDYKKVSTAINEYLSIVENPEVSAIDKMVAGISKKINF